MDSFIVEDVNELLKLKKGDSNRLNSIKEACESNEIISISDRKYIERLSSQYLRPAVQKKSKTQDTPKFIPIEEPKDVTSEENIDFETNQISEIKKPENYEKSLIFENSKEEKISKQFNFNPNKKILLAIATIALSFILIGIVVIGNDGIQLLNNSEPIQSNTLPDFSLQIDNSKYDTSDIISVSGKTSSSSTGTVRLFIENEKNKLVWAENVNLKNNGEFSTLLIAGGKGWENGGEYFLNVEHDDFTNKISFDFIVK
ncbi:MAG: hypothetical protein JRZ95_05615 [Nitrososphaerota archaeon]|jgi:hypothetical protein|nr:hypothetical protein [Nitrososphaerota archaeon]